MFFWLVACFSEGSIKSKVLHTRNLRTCFVEGSARTGVGPFEVGPWALSQLASGLFSHGFFTSRCQFHTLQVERGCMYCRVMPLPRPDTGRMLLPAVKD